MQRAEQLAADEERRRVEVEVAAAAEPPPEFFRLRVKNVGADDLAVSQSDGARAPDMVEIPVGAKEAWVVGADDDNGVHWFWLKDAAHARGAGVAAFALTPEELAAARAGL